MKIIYFRSGQTFLHELLFTIFKGIVQFAHWLPNDMRKIYYGNQWGPSTVWLPTFFKISSFVFSGREKFIQVWKDLKEILTWFYYFFFVNNSSKDVTFLCCELCANKLDLLCKGKPDSQTNRKQFAKTMVNLSENAVE